MKPADFLKSKGRGILPFGIVMLVAPEFLAGLLGTEIGSPMGILVAQLYGIAMAAMGIEMIRTRPDYMPDAGAMLGFTLGDAIATILCVIAIKETGGNVLFYILPATYALSTIGFFRSYLAAKRQPLVDLGKA